MKISTEYYSAIALLLVAVFKYFDINITEGEVMKNIEGIVALVSAAKLIYKRFQKGDINLAGIKNA